MTLWTKLLIATNECHSDAEWSHPSILGILLQILPHSRRQHFHGDLVLELHFELGGDLPEVLDEEARIIHISNHDGSDVVGDRKNIRHRVRHDQFIRHFLLATHHHAVLSSNSYRSLSKRLNSFESILHLIDSAIRGKNLHHFILSRHGEKLVF